MNRLFDLAERYVLGGLALVAAYLVLTHPTAINGLVKTTFTGVNSGFKTLQGR